MSISSQHRMTARPLTQNSSPVGLLAVALIFLCASAPIACAQPNTAAKIPPAPTAVSTAAPSEDELITTREQLISLLRTTPTLQQVVETDASLLADRDYVTRLNPQLAAFLTQHPEVTRNPDFYLFADLSEQHGRRVESLRRRVNGYQPPNDQELRRDYMADMMGSLAFIGVVGSLLWLIHILLANRRWSHLFRLQSEVHGKLIDRFAANQELLQYMETEPGKRFLEAAPIPVNFEGNQRLSGGLARVLAPLQFGIVLTLLGAGLLILHRSLPDAAGPLLIFGMVALMPGLGFILSAIITWRISAHLGLLPQTAPTEIPGRQ